jgi:formylglycine-generating enzyme required for sulfatase activity
MGRYPVTQGQWQQIMDNNPSWFKSGDDFPVECVSWMDAQKFITEISKRTGHRFSLSTEAQWEYASRSGGKKQAFAGGHDVDVMAWFRGKKGARTFKIGILSANDLGIHDLGRNVWEWCEDVYDSDAYFKHVRNNPVITAGGDFRVCRGGTKDYNPRGVRAAIRFSFSKDFRFSLLGFRITKEE